MEALAELEAVYNRIQRGDHSAEFYYYLINKFDELLTEVGRVKTW